MDLWRISIFPTLDGEGGRLAGGRWNSVGFPLVYLASSPAGALLEVLVHLQIEDDEIPTNYTLLHVSVPSGIRVSTLRIPKGEEWKNDLTQTRAIGDAWLTAGSSALARVPSAIVPRTDNYLLNPHHSDSARIQIVEIEKGLWDPRFFHRRPLA
jgi:RES domain-containing protein